MAVLPRKLQTIFGGGLVASGNIAQPGSTLGGTTVYSSDLDVLQNLAAGGASAWLLGLQDQCVGTQAQVLEEMVGVLFTATQQLAYLTERGMSEWLATQNYYQYAVAYFNGVPYRSIINNNLNQNPVTQTNAWTPLLSAVSSPSTLAATCVFNGSTGSILQSNGVSSLVKNSTGNYTVNFSTAFTNANPLMTGSSGGILRPITPALGSFNFDTAGLVGGAFAPVDYPYVSVAFAGI